MLALSNTIAALRKKADEEEAISVSKEDTTTTEATEETRNKTILTHKSQFAKPLTDDNWLVKKLSALGAVVGCAVLWQMGSWLEAAQK